MVVKIFDYHNLELSELDDKTSWTTTIASNVILSGEDTPSKNVLRES